MAGIIDSCKLTKLFTDALNYHASLKNDSVRVNRAKKIMNKSKIKSSYIHDNKIKTHLHTKKKKINASQSLEKLRQSFLRSNK